MNEQHLTIEEARTFSDPDGSYKAALNDPTVFEALCSDQEAIRALIDVFTMKVEHLEAQLSTRERRVKLDQLHAQTEVDEIKIAAAHAEWEAKVRALLRSTEFHLKRALRRAELLWDDPIESLRHIDRILLSDLGDGDALDEITKVVEKSLIIVDSHAEV